MCDEIRENMSPPTSHRIPEETTEEEDVSSNESQSSPPYNATVEAYWNDVLGSCTSSQLEFFTTDPDCMLLSNIKYPEFGQGVCVKQMDGLPKSDIFVSDERAVIKPISLKPSQCGLGIATKNIYNYFFDALLMGENEEESEKKVNLISMVVIPPAEEQKKSKSPIDGSEVCMVQTQISIPHPTNIPIASKVVTSSPAPEIPIDIKTQPSCSQHNPAYNNQRQSPGHYTKLNSNGYSSSEDFQPEKPTLKNKRKHPRFK